MRKIILVFFLLQTVLNSQSQDYLIGFSGTGASTTVDAIQVKNLTQNTRLTLNGAEVLLLFRAIASPTCGNFYHLTNAATFWSSTESKSSLHTLGTELFIIMKRMFRGTTSSTKQMGFPAGAFRIDVCLSTHSA